MTECGPPGLILRSFRSSEGLQWAAAVPTCKQVATATAAGKVAACGQRPGCRVFGCEYRCSAHGSAAARGQ
jgi:hypothetical protein